MFLMGIWGSSNERNLCANRIPSGGSRVAIPSFHLGEVEAAAAVSAGGQLARVDQITQDTHDEVEKVDQIDEPVRRCRSGFEKHD